jgi:5S rRNA maturation endonuclease (ribonuclease M5)
MNLQENLEKIEDILKELKQKNEECPILVEGEKDMEALKLVGIEGEIILINQGRSITSFCDKIADLYSEVIILTDWDRGGKRLASKIQKNLRGRIKTDMSIRYNLISSLKVKTVEGIPSYLLTLKKRS